ncbi:succinyl-diaminopimelate desuccinylase [Hoeflea prorocentri]|uniref:Succinyl-diaminopimelate desuccinylase n=1 Tax=Hoeflea prorocentri TaxID=1922333 RepID=A0A9X3ZIA4_9HYPH|nr:succinyl-diaminopimelate desuccinylase [Hoeflea prorocentri]MCY6382722.1 succinyl-diaminopimelate desuccinylase [Hoeflea prorocentri]MDA5400522.1 succinyl-diaminopimelate desuccinylase [Hoeflea prorocentri]
MTDPIANLTALIRCASVTPADNGALSALEAMLEPLGFTVDQVAFEAAGTPTINNLYARLGSDGPHLMFAGHTDVVPPGNEADWSHPPFDAAIDDGMLFGRGAVDMKGGIACFVAAIARHISAHGSPPGSISLLITGDEEGPAINGTTKVLAWAADRGEKWDGCIVGEPTNPNALGDMIKIGRRGSLSGTLTVSGVQGHAAYPHLADNPVRALLPMLESLISPPFDEGTDAFPATNLELTTVDVGNPARNVIPAQASAAFNVRFNDTWSTESLKAEIEQRLESAAADTRFRPGRNKADYELSWRDPASPVFLTRDEQLIETLAGAVEARTGKWPELSTTGGTSDARFIKDYCPVVEFGLVGQTMHMVDERTALTDLENLTGIYEEFLQRWFAP